MDEVSYRGYEIHKDESKGKFKSVIMKDTFMIDIINGMNYQVTLNHAKDRIDAILDGDDYAE